MSFYTQDERWVNGLRNYYARMPTHMTQGHRVYVLYAGRKKRYSQMVSSPVYHFHHCQDLCGAFHSQ